MFPSAFQKWRYFSHDYFMQDAHGLSSITPRDTIHFLAFPATTMVLIPTQSYDP